MNYKEIVDLIKLVNKTELTEVDIKEGEFNLKIRTKNYNAAKGKVYAAPAGPPMTYQQPPVSMASAEQTPATEQPANTPDLQPASKSEGGEPKAENLLEVKSPIVGTFYRSSSPDKPPYAKVGDEISEGSVVCIVEAMKLFNEIESEVSGTIVKVMVEDASPVEYDQVLFLVDPS